MAELVDGRLIIDYNLGTKPVIKNFNIENGRLYANYVDEYANVKAKSITILNKHIIVEGEDMAKVDLGQVVGADGKDALIDETVTGKIASFSDGCGGMPMKSIVAEITPVQSGSGDPSPTNVRPISGRTGMTVTRAGKNLLAYPYTDTTKKSNGVTFTDNGDGSITLSGTATAQTDYLLESASNGVLPPNAQLLLSGGISDNIYVRCPIDSRTVTSRGEDIALTTTGGNITGNCFIRVLSGTNCDGVTVKPMIRVAGTSDTYEPHHGTNYPISWQTEAGTIYGGTLDVVSGVLTVTDAQIASYAGETLPGEWISDRDVYVAGTTPTTGAQVVYKLATPQTYQLTPTEVRTLLGENLVYSDAGDVTVNYYADMKGYIDKRLNTTRMMIAGVETSFVATKNYAIGDFVVVNDTLYRITAVITSGETITPDTNASETTVAEQLIALYNE